MGGHEGAASRRRGTIALEIPEVFATTAVPEGYETTWTLEACVYLLVYLERTVAASEVHETARISEVHVE